jgi:dethiobiotin synthetase
MNNKIKGIFITGTDTGVGKTLVAAGLIKALQSQGIHPGYFKPVASGALKTRQGLVAPDVKFVLKTTEIEEHPSLINPVCLIPPLAPLTAAEISGTDWTTRSVLNKFRALQNRYPFLVVEGVGGVMVPLKKRFLVIDLIEKIGFPTLVVARASLGTINHTLMTLTLLKQRGLPVLGFLFNGHQGRPGLAEKTASQVISEISGVAFWGRLPFDPEVSENDYQLGSIPKRLGKMVPKFFPAGNPIKAANF